MSRLSISGIIRRSLFTWMLLPSLVITIVAGLLLALLLRTHFQESSDLAVQLYARHVNTYINDAAQGLEGLAAQLDGLDTEHQERLMDDFRNISPVFSRLMLVNAARTIMASSPADSRNHPFGLTMSPVGSGKLLLSPPLRSPGTGKLTLAMGLGGSRSKMLVGELDLERLQMHIKGLEPSRGGMIVLTDAYGTLIAHPDRDVVSRQVNIGSLPPVRDSNQIPATTLYRDNDGLHFGTSIRLPIYGWVVLANAPVAAVLGPLVRSSALFLLVIGAMLGFVIVRIKQVLEARIVAPLERFTGDIAKVSSGDYIPTPSAREYSSNELADAEETFLEMATRVRTREEELQESEGRFRQVVENVREAFWIRDIENDRILYASPAVETVFGIAPQALMEDSRAAHKLVVEEDAANFQGAYQKIMATGEPMDVKFRIRKPDGTLAWIHTKSFPVEEEGGIVRRTVGIADDITEAKRYQQALEALVQGTSTSTGDEFFYSLTKTLAEALETPHAIVTEFLDSPPTKARSLAFWKNGVHAPNFEYDLVGTPSDEVRRTGFCCREEDLQRTFPHDQFLTEVNANSYMGVALHDSQGKVCGHLAILTPGRLPQADTARSILSVFSARAGGELERMRNVRTMAQSLHEKEILLKEIHHRVKNNLQVISSLLSLQMLQIKDPEIAEMFSESCDRIRSIALVHEELYRFKDLAHIDVSAYVSTLTQRLKEAHPLHGVDIIRDVDAASLSVNAAVPMGLILNELLTNAYKHAFPDGRTGTITVAFREEGDGFVLNVSDDGIGIRPDFKVEQAESLGMQLIHNLALQLRGSLTLGAGAEGIGSAFVVTFPKGM